MTLVIFPFRMGTLECIRHKQQNDGFQREQHTFYNYHSAMFVKNPSGAMEVMRSTNSCSKIKIPLNLIMHWSRGRQIVKRDWDRIMELRTVVMHTQNRRLASLDETRLEMFLITHHAVTAAGFLHTTRRKRRPATFCRQVEGKITATD